MNMRIVKNSDGINGKVLGNGLFLEKEIRESEHENVKALKYYIYNLETNSKTEILPKVKKYDLGEVFNININSKYVYFFSCMDLNYEKAEINVVRYDYENDESSTVYTFTDDVNQYNAYKRMKMFVINDLYLIVENELMRSNFADTYEGYLDFELYLYSIKDNKRTDILDENLVNNGIATMIPLSENACVIKTGFSLLKDARYRFLEKSEASVEGVSIINPAQLVSDILLMKTNIVLDTMDQTYYSQTIPNINKVDDYIVYSRVNTETHDEEMVFYNYMTRQATCCIGKNVFEEKDLTKYDVINNVPYIRLVGREKTDFYNLLKNRIEMTFPKSEKVVDVVGDLILTVSKKKSIFAGAVDYVNIYKYPYNELLHKEKGLYSGCIMTGKDNFYILTKK